MNPSIKLEKLSLHTTLIFLKEQVPYHIYEYCQIGNGYLEMNGERIGTFDVEERTGVPIFKIGEKPNNSNTEEIRKTSVRKALENLFNSNFELDKDGYVYLGNLEYREVLGSGMVRSDIYFSPSKYEFKISHFPVHETTKIGYFYNNNEDLALLGKEIKKRANAYLMYCGGYAHTTL